MRTPCPSGKPASARPRWNSAKRYAVSVRNRPLRKPRSGTVACAARAAFASNPAAAQAPKTNSRRLVCREKSIVGDDGGRFTTPPPSRLEARSRLGDKAANELGAPVVSSIPAQLPGPEPASARKGREDDRAVLRWNRRVAGPA